MTPKLRASVLGAAITAALAAAAPSALAAGPASLVNPIIGTSGANDTFPGPDMPFGMMQFSPDTSPQRPAGGGYEYQSKSIMGYSLTHISGPGCGAYGDIPILPTVGAIPDKPGDATQPLDHTAESVSTGYYKLTAGGVTTELTDAMRAGSARFTFPASAQSNLIFKLNGTASQVDGTSATVVNSKRLVGSVTAGHFCGAGDQRDYTLHFDIRFDQPMTAQKPYDGGISLTFDTTKTKVVNAR